jgi:recombination protein RecT
MSENTQLTPQEQAKLNNGNIVPFMTHPAIQKSISNMIGEEKTTRFVGSIISAVQANKQLGECTNSSILSAALLGESLELPPSPQLGFYYFVPYKNKGVYEAQFQMGWKGLVQLAERSGQYRKIVASEVKEGELVEYNPITEEFTLSPIADDVARQKAKVIGFYAMFELTNGFRKEIYWSKEKMQHHAETYSSGYRSDIKNKTKYTFWSKDFSSMALKTMLRQLISKWGIMSIQMQKAYQGDQAIIREDGTYDYVDNTETPEEVIDSVATEVSENQNTIPFEPES